MFTLACEEAAKFTRPVIISTRTVDGSVRSGIGSFVVVNASWVVTAAHVMQAAKQANDDAPDVATYDTEVARLSAVAAGNPNKMRNTLKRLHASYGKKIRNVSYWWAEDSAHHSTFTAYWAQDVAVCQVAGMTSPSAYPVFERSANVKAGTSLIKVGYPFSETPTSWDDTISRFRVDTSGLSLFPIDGIYTRTTQAVDVDGIPVKFVETSTPGLRGQSGGPTLNKEGHVCAIQSQTQHYPLGFAPELKDEKGRTHVEHQVLNVGWGVHPDVLEEVFQRHGIAMTWA